jgi:arginine exporter protein ArgO
MKNGIINALIVAFVVVLVFYGIRGCFFLMNQASSLANVLGFIGIVGIITFSFYEIKEIIKQLNK